MICSHKDKAVVALLQGFVALSYRDCSFPYSALPIRQPGAGAQSNALDEGHVQREVLGVLLGSRYVHLNNVLTELC